MKRNYAVMIVLILALVLCACNSQSTPKNAGADHTHQWENGICAVCGEVCAHNRYDAGYCKRCGLFHEDHSWGVESVQGSSMNDVCEICGYKCLHPELNANHICTMCGKEIIHRYSDATHTCVAPGCGVTSQYFYEGVPEEYRAVSSNPGEIVEIEYSAPMYLAEKADPSYAGKTIDKILYVYLPAGYDPGRPYDILYLIHGRGGEPATWLIQQQWTKNVVDNLMDRKEANPCIIVTPSYYYGSKELDEGLLKDSGDFSRYFYLELRNDIMPLIETTYLTYANGDVSPEGLAASRDHRAIAGFSRGASTTGQSGLLKSLDYFSYFGCFSSLGITGEELNESILTEGFEPYQIHFMYNGNGRCDYTRTGHLNSYQSIVEKCDKLTEGENTVFVDKYGFEHDAENNSQDLFNFMMFDLFKH